ncbi:unnamed protein product, partial [Hapterophycus canaliculatus]
APKEGEGGSHPPTLGDSLPPPLPLPLPPPPLPTPPLAAALTDGEGSSTTGMSGLPFGKTAAEISTGSGSPAAPRGVGRDGAAGLEESRGAGARTANGAVGAARASAAAQGTGGAGSGRAGTRDARLDGVPKAGGGIAGVGGGSGGGTGSNGTRPEPTASSATTRAPSAEGTEADVADTERSSATTPSAVSSRFLSAPLGVLSAVGAWATGRGRSSVGSTSSAAADAASAAAATAASSAGAGDRRDSDQAAYARTSGDWRGSTSPGEDASTLEARRTTGDSPCLSGENGTSGGRARARPPALKLDGSTRDAPIHEGGDSGGHQTNASAPARRLPDVVAPGSGMDLESPLPYDGSAEGAAGETAVTNGKRKPVCSPAVTPDGPNPGQHFGGA